MGRRALATWGKTCGGAERVLYRSHLGNAYRHQEIRRCMQTSVRKKTKFLLGNAEFHGICCSFGDLTSNP